MGRFDSDELLLGGHGEDGPPGLTGAVWRGMVTFGADRLVDEDGRPLAEVGSPLYATVPTEEIACPYADARRGLPMNRSALRQLVSVWPEVLASARALAGPEPTVHAAWAVAIVGLAAPLVHDATRGGPVPRSLAAAFKTSLGFSQVLTALLLSADGMADAPLRALGDRDAFLRALEDGRWLIGARQVCAGSPQQIGDLYEAVAGLGAGEARRSEALDALGPVASWRDTAAQAVGASVAWLTGLTARQRDGDPAPGGPLGARWLGGDVPPWLRSVLAVPGRPSGHARRLFLRDQVPARVEAWIT